MGHPVLTEFWHFVWKNSLCITHETHCQLFSGQWQHLALQECVAHGLSLQEVLNSSLRCSILKVHKPGWDKCVFTISVSTAVISSSIKPVLFLMPTQTHIWKKQVIVTLLYPKPLKIPLQDVQHMCYWNFPPLWVGCMCTQSIADETISLNVYFSKNNVTTPTELNCSL